jgi:Mlc titration factor MtfA (ptsG expression regulator)
MDLPTKEEQKRISKTTQRFLKRRKEYISFNGFAFTKSQKLPTAPKMRRRCA